MAITFPTDPGAQTPVNTFSPSSTPVANSANGNTYVWNGTAWTTQQANLEQYVNVAGDVMTGTLTVPTVDATTLNAGNIVLPDAGGITFGTSYGGAGTGTSKVLDDYEEGTWTATLTGATAAPTVAVTATGRYIKIGRSVTVSVTFSFVDTTGASGQMQILGLPFTIFNDIQARSYSVMLCGNMNVTGYAVARGETNSTQVKAFRTDGNAQDSLLIAAGSNKYVGFSLTYEAA